MLSYASWEAPTQNRIIPNDDTFTVHSFSKIRIRSGAPRGFGVLVRMAIYLQGAGEHW